ncbi:MAG: peptide chain release factor N(5)-glutamine methyltransferase [Candidatus Izimaplasma sp.]|nr:peptide chain release factor N(5)-glutamine methyltransferase [Candidatus Izimaplasma bacterium]
MPTYKEALMINEQYALDNQQEATGIKILLQHFSKLSHAKLFENLDETMPEQDYKAFRDAVDQYVIKNIPVQHITQKEYFYGYEFFVNKDVLIPRFETEELVANILLIYDEIFNQTPVKVVDIGTGSGCLAITLDKEEPNMSVSASDISKEALTVAHKNNTILGANVTFKQGDMLTPFQDQKFDILVSNPPYIPKDEMVEDLVKDNEPHIALFGGTDGLDFYRIIIKEAKNVLNDRFIMAFEHAYDKKTVLKALIEKHYDNVEIRQLKDMQGKDRMTFVIKR